MLTDKQISLLAQPLIDTYSRVELELLTWIAEKFSAYSYVGGDLEWKLTQLAKMGGLDTRAIEIIAQLNGLPFVQVHAAIEKAGIQSIDYKTYRQAFGEGLTSVNVDNILFNTVAQAVYGEVSSEMRLIHQEISNNVSRAYMQVLDQINLETVTGVYDYNTSLKRALTKLADKGITAQTYYRRVKTDDGEILQPVEYSIEAVARRTIVSAIVRSSNAHNEKYIEESGAEYIATSQHMGARNKGIGHQNHESWQGQAFLKIGSDSKYRNFTETCGDGLVDGIGGANCRHTRFAYFPGISVPIKRLYDIEENGRIYDLEQKQRGMERNVRNAKKQLEMAKRTGDEEFITKSRKKISDRQSKLKKFVDSHNELRRDYNREKIQI